jgi:hypothetical protein
MDGRPRSGGRLVGCILVLRKWVGIQYDGVLELEELVAIDEGAGVGAHSILGTPHGMKSNSRDSPEVRPSKKVSSSAPTASPARGD